MSHQALINSLKRKVVSPIYLFWGEETYLLDKILYEFKHNLVPPEVRDFNLDIIEGKNTSPEEVVTLASTLPFMADKRVVIVEGVDYFKSRKKGSGAIDDNKKSDDVLLDYLKDPLNTTCLVFTSDTVDRRGKIFKAVKKSGVAEEFVLLKNFELNDWIEKLVNQAGKNIKPEATAELIAAVGNNLRVLDSELQKLFSYIGNRKVINREDVLELVSKTAQLNIFKLIDAISERNYKNTIQMMREMITFGDPPVRILFMVARQFRILLQAKNLYKLGYAQKQVASQLQIHPFVAQKCFNQAKNFSRAELEEALEKILETDVAIKTGTMEVVLALELLFNHLCTREAS